MAEAGTTALAGAQLTTAALEALPDAAFATDSDGRIVAWNAGAQKLLGWPAAATMGARCARVLEGVGQDGHLVCAEPCPLLCGLATASSPGHSEGAVSPVCAGSRPTLSADAFVRQPPHPDMLVRRADDTRVSVVVIAVPCVLDDSTALLHLLRPVPGSERDPLTGALSRDGVMLRVLDEQHRAMRTGHSVALALVDVDGLKQVNDRFGHTAGDRLLVAVATQLRSGRREDLVGRWGGDEFLVVLPETDRHRTARRLRRTLSALRRDDAGGPGGTFSAGVVDLRPTEPLASAVERADAALYRAKRAGRACVRTAGAPPP